MNQISIFPSLAGIAAVGMALYLAVKKNHVHKQAWVFPALLSVLFFALSMQAILTEGPLGFWPEHTRNLWGNQIWYDLLLAVLAALFFAIPQAQSLNMRVLPWVLLVLATGSIGLYAFLARMLYLRERQAA